LRGCCGKVDGDLVHTEKAVSGWRAGSFWQHAVDLDVTEGLGFGGCRESLQQLVCIRLFVDWGLCIVRSVSGRGLVGVPGQLCDLLPPGPPPQVLKAQRGCLACISIGPQANCDNCIISTHPLGTIDPPRVCECTNHPQQTHTPVLFSRQMSVAKVFNALVSPFQV
jgi:hypothetical protein